ncbi:hypothetical protein PQC07_gp203 [Aeromonas phage D3]|uniref:Uncharacterized protein n=2 Tax=Ludhianavirus TaxID=3044751 RepID=A0A514A1N0_9CAUD|nr:hypothetical protein PQC06_gp003 [Aeromonas phage LAh10]YP_010668553.1 hypothetical protein PQC07_gp203 [Aeromonas phage D3]QDH47132.1 hypothetical protein LAh10_3 [Aeromonas phage LAh10]QDJ97069.1 hypothetical protein D3_0072 [Aeromonas phage D3]
MSNKVQLKAARKRAERKVASSRKNGRRRLAIHQSVPQLMEAAKSQIELALERHQLESPFDIARRSDGSEVPAMDKGAMIQGCRKSTTEVFRMFSYLAAAKSLVDQGRIEFEFKLDLDQCAADIAALDRRVIRLNVLVEGEDDVFGYELMDIGSTLENLGSVIYDEVSRLEPQALVLDSYINHAAQQVVADPENEIADLKQANQTVLQSLAYTLIKPHMVNKA